MKREKNRVECGKGIDSRRYSPNWGHSTASFWPHRILNSLPVENKVPSKNADRDCRHSIRGVVFKAIVANVVDDGSDYVGLVISDTVEKWL